MVTITIENEDSPTMRAKKVRSMARPTKPAASKASGTAASRGSSRSAASHQTMKPPRTTNSPCAMLKTLLAR